MLYCIYFICLFVFICTYNRVNKTIADIFIIIDGAMDCSIPAFGRQREDNAPSGKG